MTETLFDGLEVLVHSLKRSLKGFVKLGIAEERKGHTFVRSSWSLCMTVSVCFCFWSSINIRFEIEAIC